eukprot:357849-Chlamydomonas_euryale.AAC.4
MLACRCAAGVVDTDGGACLFAGSDCDDRRCPRQSDTPPAPEAESRRPVPEAEWRQPTPKAE